MLIGIMSDTHDNIPLVRRAIEIFNEKKVGYVIHAGDYTSPFTLKLFQELQCEYVGIFGNNDGDRLLLQERAGGKLRNQPCILTLQNRKIVVMHEHHVADALADSGHFDLVVYGHTHKADVRKVNSTLVVNPGEVSTYLYGQSTIAIVDLETLEGEIVEIKL